MIDFPASPTDGQIFSATNGVVYKYSAAYSSWLAQNPAPAIGGTGDFYGVYNGADFALGTTAITMPIATMVTGNSGGWYGLGTTSRYIPPAGRYKIFAGYGFYAPGVNCYGFIHIRKNGVQVGAEYQINQPTTGTLLQPIIEGIFDANGSDYFEIFIRSGQAGSNGRTCYFGAFPLTGMQGPTGGAPGPVVGDFSATQNIAFALPTGAGQPLTFNTVVTGNSGGYYSTSTGRYTPPAGRYFIQAMLYGANSTTPTTINLQIRKNGTVVYTAGSVAALANFNGEVACEGLVDANGTDYFDLFASSNNGTTSTNGNFTAFPTQGMVGPQGPPGTLPAGALSLYAEVLLTSNQNIMQVAWPSGVRKIEIEYFVINAANATDTVQFRAMVNGVPQSATGYASQYVFGSGSTPNSGLLTNLTFWQALAGMVVTKGTLKPAVTSTQTFAEHTQVGNNTSASYALEAYHWGGPTGNMNGIQMFNTGGITWLPGSFLRVYVVP